MFLIDEIKLLSDYLIELDDGNRLVFSDTAYDKYFFIYGKNTRYFRTLQNYFRTLFLEIIIIMI